MIPHLMRPEYLWALVPAAVLALFLWRLRNRSGGWSKVIAPELLPHLMGPGTGRARRNLAPLALLFWTLAVFAAAGPSWQKIPQPVHQKQDALVLVLDLSYSMTAGDLAPSRIDRARQKLLDLLKLRQEGQTGLIAYAGDAHIVTPLTDDTPTIANLLPALHPTIMPIPGSEPAAAVEQAIALLRSAGFRQGRILLLSDGISSRDRQKLGGLLAGSGVQLSVMGIGSSTGAPLPLPRGGFLKDENGAIVTPALEEGELRGLAADTAGRYMRMQINNSDIEYLLADNPLQLQESALALDRSADTWEDQGYWLLLLLLPPVLALFRRGWLVCLLPLLVLPTSPRAEAGMWEDLWLTPDQQGQRALQQQDAESAAQLFEDAQWAGTAAYRSGDYESAVSRFSDSDSADAWYNRGNALARAGQLDEAIAAYKESLQREPEQTDALENLALLEQLKQQQEQQSQQQSGNEKDNNQGGEQNKDQNQAQDGGQQTAQNGDEPDQQQNGASEDNSGQSQEQPGEEQSSGTNDESQGAAEEHADKDKGEEQSQSGSTGEQAADEHQPLPPPDHTAAGQAMQENAEKDQAMEQWLRRVPDDPSGLLREKFRYESRRRQRDAEGDNDSTYW